MLSATTRPDFPLASSHDSAILSLGNITGLREGNNVIFQPGLELNIRPQLKDLQRRSKILLVDIEVFEKLSQRRLEIRGASWQFSGHMLG